jgi:hypothetical protein
MSRPLPTPAEMLVAAERELSNAYAALGDAADWLRSDWPAGTEMTREQAARRTRMMTEIGKAKDAINRAKGGAR